METDFLRSLLLIAETGSIAEASRRLAITPGAVAQQVKALERSLGVVLLVRAGRTVSPTPAAHRLLDAARILVGAEADMRAQVREDEVAGELRLGTINTALHTVLPQILLGLSTAHPRVTVFILSGTSQQLLESISRMEIDAAVCLQPSFRLPKHLGWTKLREEESLVVVKGGGARRGC